MNTFLFVGRVRLFYLQDKGGASTIFPPEKDKAPGLLQGPLCYGFPLLTAITAVASLLQGASPWFSPIAFLKDQLSPSLTAANTKALNT